jgi:hypothetical protein
MSDTAEKGNGTTGSGPADRMSRKERDDIAIGQSSLIQQQAHPTPEAFAPPHPWGIYEDRLREIWQATHNGYSPPGAAGGNTDAWNLVREAVAGVGNLALIGAAVVEQHRRRAAGVAGTQDAALAGDPGTVEFLVGSAIEQLSPEQIPAFISGPLAHTVERLEREVGLTQDVTRERIVDIVLRALGPLRGTPPAGRLVARLLGFLSGEQRMPTIGIYATVTGIAQLAIGLNDRRNRLERIFLYHYTLLGVWRLLQDQGFPFDAPARQIVSIAAGNAGLNLWQLLPEGTDGAQGVEAVVGLRTILAVTAREVAVPDDQAAKILEALGLPHREARAALTVLNETGALGGPWTTDAVDLARLESAGAVVSIATGLTPDQPAARLYNAAVSLQGIAEPRAAGPLRARMLLDGLGLRWSLLLADDVVDALDRLEGLDCASGFLHALGQYQDEGHDQAKFRAPVTELGMLLSELPKRLPRDRPGLAAGAARLADAASRAGLPGSPAPRDVGIGELAAATLRAIDGLRLSGARPEADDHEAQLVDTAALIRSVFDEILGRTTWGLAETIRELVELRSSPREEFVRLYMPLAGPPESRLGTGPPVAAGVATQEEWDALVSALLQDPGSIVPALLQEFPRQL